MKRYIISSVISIMLLVFTACGGGGSSSSSDDPDVTQNYTQLIHSLDLSDAEGIYITGDKSEVQKSIALQNKAVPNDENQVDLDPNSIYKITSDGKLSRVAIEDENGTELSRGAVKPVAIQDLNNLYLLLWLTTAENTEHADPFLVHKETGLAYNASEVVYGTSLDETPDIDIQWDDANNFYVTHDVYAEDGTYSTKLYMIDTSKLGTESLDAKEISLAFSLEHKKWIVDASGKFILIGISADGEIEPLYMLSLETGVLHNLNELIDSTFRADWIVDLDNQIYTYIYNWDDDNVTWYRIEVDDSAKPVIKEVVTTKEYPVHWALSPKERHVVAGKLVYITIEDSSAFAIEEIDPQTGSVFHAVESFEGKFIPSNSSLEKDNDYVTFTISDTNIYISGKFPDTGAFGIYKYDVATRSGTAIRVDSDYALTSYTVLSSGEFLVEAIRLSDQADIYGKLSEDGSIDVTSVMALDAPEVLTMQAIKPSDFISLDGSANDWSTELRVSVDTTDKNILDFYSQTESDRLYYGMLEIKQDIDPTYHLVFTFDDDKLLSISDSNVTFPQNDTTLSSEGGILAKGEVIEFAIPLDKLESATLQSIEIFGSTQDGDLNNTNSIERISF